MLVLNGSIFKKAVCAVLAAILIAGCFYTGTEASAANKSFEQDGFTFTIIDSENLLVSLKKAPEEAGDGYYIPARIRHRKKTYTITEIGNAAYAFTDIEDAAIPGTVTRIGDSAFAGCSALKHVYIPAGLESIGNGVFSYCDGLTDIEIDPENKAFIFSKGILYSADMKKLLWGSGSVKASCEVADGTVEICSYAFEGNKVITKVKLPTSLHKIGSGAFMDCPVLKSVTISKNVKTIEGNPFMYCPALESISVAKGNKSYSADKSGLLLNAKKTSLVSASAARGDIELPETVKKIVKGAAVGNTGITSVTINSKVKTIEEFAFADCSSLAKVIFKSRKTALPEEGGVFKNTYYYLDVTVPYPSGSGVQGDFEDLIRSNSPNGVIVIWK